MIKILTLIMIMLLNDESDTAHYCNLLLQLLSHSRTIISKIEREREREKGVEREERAKGERLKQARRHARARAHTHTHTHLQGGG